MLPDPSRYLVGGEPAAVVVPARVARMLDRLVLDAFRRNYRTSDPELSAVLVAIHDAGLQYAATAPAGRTPLPQADELATSGHDLLSTEAVAERLQCKPRNVRDLHGRGRLVGHKVAGRLLFTPEAVDGYVATRLAS